MKKGILSVILASAFIASSCMTVCAAPQAMSDGGMFDVQYYAQNNPDVTAVFGTDANVLYEHYKNFGKAEGRKPYEEAAGNNTATESSVPAGFATIHINQKDGWEGFTSLGIDKTQYPGIDSIGHLEEFDIGDWVKRLYDENGKKRATMSISAGSETEDLMAYLVGEDGILESCVKHSPTEYSFYFLNNGSRYRLDLHYNNNLRLQSIDYGVVAAVTQQEVEAAKMNLPNLVKANRTVTHIEDLGYWGF